MLQKIICDVVRIATIAALSVQRCVCFDEFSKTANKQRQIADGENAWLKQVVICFYTQQAVEVLRK